MKKFGLDVDGVLYKFNHTGQYMLAKREGLADREDLQPWRIDEYDHGRPRTDWEWLLEPPQANKVFRHGHLYGGAIEFVEALSKLGDVHLITKRPKAGVQATLDWVAFQELPIAGLSIIGLDEHKSEIKCDAYIDDSPANIQELLDNTPHNVPLILLDRPWNQDYGHPFDGVYRAMSFDDVISFLTPPWGEKE